MSPSTILLLTLATYVGAIHLNIYLFLLFNRKLVDGARGNREDTRSCRIYKHVKRARWLRVHLRWGRTNRRMRTSSPPAKVSSALPDGQPLPSISLRSPVCSQLDNSLLSSPLPETLNRNLPNLHSILRFLFYKYVGSENFSAMYTFQLLWLKMVMTERLVCM